MALDENRVPRWWSVRDLIMAFLQLRDSVVLHRSEYRLEKVTARRHLVAGLMKIHLDIDAAVAVIRGSETVDEARKGLQERFKIDAEQADYVLSLQLRRLTKLDVIELQAEAEKLDAEFAELNDLVTNPESRRKVIDKELVETAKLFKGPEYDRRTVLDFDATPVSRGDEDGSRERKVNTAWRLDDRGVFSDSTVSCSPPASAGLCGPTVASSSRPATVCRSRSATSRSRPTSPVWCARVCFRRATTWRS